MHGLWKEGEGMSWADSCDLEYALADFKAENERLQAENDSLRKELAVTNPLFETLNAANDRLIYENMKLRELVRDMYKAFVHGNCYRWCEFKEPCNYISDGKCQWYDRMCELGVEV